MDTEKCDKEAVIEIDGEVIKRVSNLEYLGTRIEANGKTTPEVRWRLVIATAKTNKMVSIWKGQYKDTKVRVLRNAIVPTAIYRCEAWTTNKQDTKRINFEMKCYKKYSEYHGQKKWQMKSTEKNWYVNIVTPFDHSDIKWHISLEKHILEARIKGKRGKGRPTRWENDTVNWMKTTITEADRISRDRMLYCKKVWEATSNQLICYQWWWYNILDN